jgi:hypothetical protein
MDKLEQSHAVLKHLDHIKPMLQLDFNYVKLVYEKLTKFRPDHISLNYYDVLSSDVLKIFPNQKSILAKLVEKFQFHKPYVGMSVMVLDILTTLCVFTTGSVTEKSKLLFDCYNLNRTGLMEEFEHVNFILRIVECMKKMKLLGLIDITADDAKYIALEARVKNVDNAITFIPGLHVADFTRWIQTSNECQILFRFTKVLNRLVDSLHALSERTNAVLNIMDSKMQYKMNARHVPSPDMLLREGGCLHTNAPVVVVFRSQSVISLAVRLMDSDWEVSEVFIKYDKVVSCPHMLYDIPRAILKRNVAQYRANAVEQLHCCAKSYVLTSYMRVEIATTPLQRCREGVLFVRIDLPNLDSGSNYFVSLYTPSTRYRTVQVQTLRAPATITASAVTPAAKAKERRVGGGSPSHRRADHAGGDDEGSLNEGEGEESSFGSDDSGGHQRKRKRKKRVDDVLKDQHDVACGGLCVLPATLTASNAEKYVKHIIPRTAEGDFPELINPSLVVFTGSVVPIEEVRFNLTLFVCFMFAVYLIYLFGFCINRC